MAGLIERGNTYYAIFYQNGKQIRVSTKVHVRPTGRDGRMTAKMLRRLAEQTAASMEMGARGEISQRQALQAVRALLGGRKLPSVRQYLEQFGQRATREGKRNTEPALRSFLRLMPHSADLPLDGVNRAMAEEYVRRALDEVSGSTVDRRLADLSACFNYAIKEELLEKSPFRGVRVPKWEIQPHERKPMTREDLRIIFETFPGDWPDMVAVCLLLGGQRLGDVATMTWEQVLFEQGMVRLKSQKTKRPMLKPMVPALRKIFERRKYQNGDSFFAVFPYAEARVRCAGGKTNAISLEFSELCREAGISVKLDSASTATRAHKLTDKTFHSLRSTATTFLLDSGAPPELVRYIVGHDDKEIERRHYYKPSPEREAEYISALGGLLGMS